MKIALYNQEAKNIDQIEVSDILLGSKINKDLIYQVATSQLSNRRQVIAHTKGRGDVRGGGKKPWQQKGTGRARHGSIRSPIWKGGGVTFGPTNERNFKKDINKKMARKAVCAVLSAKNKDGAITFVDAINLENAKTRELVKVINNFKSLWGDKGSIILVAPEKSEMIVRAGKNIPKLNIVEARSLNALDLLSSKRVLMMKDALESVEKVFTK